MKRMSLVWFVLPLILIVLTVIVCGCRLGNSRDRQNLESKAGVDLVSAGDTPLSDEPLTDEIRKVPVRSQGEAPNLTPEEMQELMEESGQKSDQNSSLPPGHENEDGPGPGFDKSDIPADCLPPTK